MKRNERRIPDEGLSILTACTSYAIFPMGVSLQVTEFRGLFCTRRALRPPERRSSIAVVRVAVLIFVASVRHETGFDDVKWSSSVKKVIF